MHHETKSKTLSYIASLPPPEIESFDFSLLTFEDIEDIILSIRSNAMECDSISCRMIVTIIDHILPAISHIIDFSLDSGIFPSVSRKAFIIPLPKNTNPFLPEHFRPISILTFLSKVVEVCFIGNSSSLLISRIFSVPYNRSSDPVTAQPSPFSNLLVTFGRVWRTPNHSAGFNELLQ